MILCPVWLLLGEPLTLRLVVGGAVTIGGVGLIQLAAETVRSAEAEAVKLR